MKLTEALNAYVAGVLPGLVGVIVIVAVIVVGYLMVRSGVGR